MKPPKILITALALFGFFLAWPFLQSHQSGVKISMGRDASQYHDAALPVQSTQPAPSFSVASPVSGGVIENAFRNHNSGIAVQESGMVSRLLPDDNKGSRHQRFIVSLSTGHTVLIAHNIDIAPRLNALREGDQVMFSGVYEWNEKGGVVHWTHHDPSGQHAAGYLQHNGSVYQ